MREEEIRKELVRIAVAEIGKKNVASTSIKPDVDFDGTQALEVTVTLKADAPSVSGEAYISFLFKSRDFLYAQDDERRPRLTLERLQSENVTTAK